MVTVIAGSVAVVLIFFSGEFLLLWTQNPILSSKSSDLLRMLLLGTLVGTINWIPYQMQLAHGWTSLSVYLSSLAAGAIACLMIWLVHHTV